MAVYAISGKLGSGKGKAAVDQIRRYLRAGKRVATNCDLFLEHLMDDRDRGLVIRIPDKPSAADLYMIGSGNKFIEFDPIIEIGESAITGKAPSPRLLKGFDEAHNGVLVLDETASWLNTRNFQDKGRAEILEWFIHGRKYGWDIMFLMQNPSQIDKQLRDSLFEYVVRMNRLDRLKVPVVSGVLKFITAGASRGTLPRVHIGVVRLGSSPDGLIADRWVFRGDDLNDSYNTTQVFSDSYPHGAHCLLSAWHLSARAGVPLDFVGPARPGPYDLQLLRHRTPPAKPIPKHMSKFLMMAMCIGLLLGAALTRFYFPRTIEVAADASGGRVYSDRLKGIGYLRLPDKRFVVSISDGREVEPLNILFLPSGGWEAEIAKGEWIKGNQ